MPYSAICVAVFLSATFGVCEGTDANDIDNHDTVQGSLLQAQMEQTGGQHSFYSSDDADDLTDQDEFTKVKAMIQNLGTRLEKDAADASSNQAIHRHTSSDKSERSALQRVLSHGKSLRLARLSAFAAAENPFAVVLEEIDKMLGVIEKEGKADKKKFDWCNERLVTLIEGTETGLKRQIAATEESLATNVKSQDDDTKERKEDNRNYQAAADAYLLKIKPGCDFITTNIHLRDENRKTETEALTKAKKLFEATPAYQAHNETLDRQEKCLPICEENTEEHVECKACLAGTSITGYCAGHQDTEGC